MLGGGNRIVFTPVNIVFDQAPDLDLRELFETTPTLLVFDGARIADRSKIVHKRDRTGPGLPPSTSLLLDVGQRSLGSVHVILVLVEEVLVVLIIPGILCQDVRVPARGEALPVPGLVEELYLKLKIAMLVRGPAPHQGHDVEDLIGPCLLARLAPSLVRGVYWHSCFLVLGVARLAASRVVNVLVLDENMIAIRINIIARLGELVILLGEISLVVPELELDQEDRCTVLQLVIFICILVDLGDVSRDSLDTDFRV